MTIERRKYVRFLVQDMAFAAIRNGFKKVGKINDISIKGLAFSYLSETNEADADPHPPKVDIFLSGNGFHLSNVPCRIVYDTPDVAPYKGSFVKTSRCGLHFGELIESQSELLENFIKNHTTGLVST
jgi:hypothetical protein